MSPPTGLKFVELTPRQEALDKLFAAHTTRACILQPGGWFLHSDYKKYCNDIKNFEFLETDVVVMTMPKSGTTWTQELVWTIMKNPNLNNPDADLPLDTRSPTIGLLSAFYARAKLAESDEKNGESVNVETKNPVKEFLGRLSSYSGGHRILKTHFSFPMLSETASTKAKIVYVIRDPRDVCISYFHHSRIFKFLKFQGTFDQYIDAFIEGLAPYSPYWSHVVQAWEKRHLPNVHIIFYEKMRSNPKLEIVKLNEFLQANLNEEQIEKIAHYTSFPEMKKRNNYFVSKNDEIIFLDQRLANDEGGFFRSGTSGGWRNLLTQDQKDKFETWIQENCPDKEILDNFLNA